MSRGKERIFVIKPAEKDWRGDPTGEESDPVQVNGCKIWPRTSTENSARGEVIIDGLNVYIPKLPIGLTLTALDQVEARGKRWDVEGQPGDYGRKGLIVMLKKVGQVV